MRQVLSSIPAVECEAEWSRYLPGFQLTHTIHIVSRVDLSMTSRAADYLTDQQDNVSSWTLVRSGDVFDQKIVLHDVSEQRVRHLREQLLALDDVLRVRLEHQFDRRRHA